MNPQNGYPTTSADMAEQIPLCIDLTEEFSDNDDVEILECFTNTDKNKNEEYSDNSSSSKTLDDLENDLDSEAITISDDDGNEDGDGKNIDPEKMICHRCVTKKEGVWKDQRRFLAHIKRHIVAGQFRCVVCYKPFIKLGECLKHERIYHRNGENAGDLDNFRKSTAMYAYRGPKVSSILESYAIQISGLLGKKASKINGVAKVAVKNHKRNVKLKRAEYKLGRLNARGGREKTANNPLKRVTRKATSALGNGANEPSIEVEANGA